MAYVPASPCPRAVRQRPAPALCRSVEPGGGTPRLPRGRGGLSRAGATSPLWLRPHGEALGTPVGSRSQEGSGFPV